ncbi:hypothetical protein G6553_10640 [Nocardioides sp. IC4_145]|uniref:hypothetical protein n=1 Tax=Nocardioides sp. IC4_145 TaxID=2714037 RepID=UPI00140B5D28|nr:hypothetical protein [Nocardioides sp. IC4_145]NHC23624.1 hypothetical protein [Nocardioides sp. IC4_145]
MKIYAVALGALWFVPTAALVTLVGVGGLLLHVPAGEKVFAAAYFALFLGAPIAAVLTVVVVPVIALSRWADRPEPEDGPRS